MTFFGRLLGLYKGKEKIATIKDKIVAGKERDIKDLQKINKTIRLLLEEGHIEITIKGVRGVIEGDRK